MSYFRKTLNIPIDEKILKIYRRFLLSLFWSFALGFLLIVVDFLLIYPFFRWGNWGVLIFTLLLVAGGFFIGRTLMIWYFDSLILTPKRLIDVDQKGFFSRHVVETSWDKIQNVSYKEKGMFATVFHYGNILIDTMGAATLQARDVHRAGLCQKFITDYLSDKAYLNSDDTLSKLNIPQSAIKNLLDEDVMHVLNALSDGVGPSRFKKLLEKFNKPRGNQG